MSQRRSSVYRTCQREAGEPADGIRGGGAFVGVADFDQALRDPAHPTRMLPSYDCGDGLHPSDLGYNKIGDAIELSLFD